MGSYLDDSAFVLPVSLLVVYQHTLYVIAVGRIQFDIFQLQARLDIRWYPNFSGSSFSFTPLFIPTSVYSTPSRFDYLPEKQQGF